MTASQRYLLRAAAGFLAVTVVALLAAWVGVRAGHVAAPSKPTPAPARVVTVGAARLAVPADWRPVPVAKTGIAGLDARRAVAFETVPGLAAWAVAVFSPTVQPSLLPNELRSQLDGRLPTPAATRVEGWPTWTYRNVTAGPSGPRADITVLATTGGVLAIACTRILASAAEAGCPYDVESVAVRGATPLVPSPSLALALRLPTVVDGLNRARLEHRASLSAAGSGEAQVAAARRLAADHRVAVRAVREAAGPAGAPLMRDLSDAADAYDALAGATETASPNGFAAARAALQEAEMQLASGVRDVPPAVMARAARPRTPSAVRQSPGHPASGGGVPGFAFALLILLAAAAGVAVGLSDAPSRLWRAAVRPTPPEPSSAAGPAA